MGPPPGRHAGHTAVDAHHRKHRQAVPCQPHDGRLPEPVPAPQQHNEGQHIGSVAHHEHQVVRDLPPDPPCKILHKLRRIAGIGRVFRRVRNETDRHQQGQPDKQHARDLVDQAHVAFAVPARCPGRRSYRHCVTPSVLSGESVWTLNCATRQTLGTYAPVALLLQDGDTGIV